MKTLTLALTLLTLAPLSSQAGQCSLLIEKNGDLFLYAGNGRSLEIEVKRKQDHLSVLLQICNEVHAATHCRGYTLEKDEWQHQAGDPKGFNVNMGRDRAELTIGALPSWIAQFATTNYNRDQNGIYHSVSACESNRLRIALEVAERAQESIKDQEAAERASERRGLIEQSDRPYWGPKF
ncbi:MAG: hypothetical protein KGP28_00660 [Bdellovibrionales bacterium]|nr:hypothetical protein [Bdellovibrionales bacterium]